MMKQFIIVVDIGNTSISFALARAGRLSHITRLATGQANVATVRDALVTLSRGKGIDDAALCSVVPKQTAIWKKELRRLTGVQPLIIQHQLKLGITLDYPEPATIGADRLANAVAARQLYGTPVIVADFGTALTFDVVSCAGAYLGGIIAPGLPLMLDYLAERTACLPRLSPATKFKASQPVIGKSTEKAMRAGMRLGYTGMVREIFSSLRKAMRGAKLCATGGYTNWALDGLKLNIKIEPHLTLLGIQYIYHLNRSQPHYD